MVIETGIPLSMMLNTVQHYIMLRKGIVVIITPPVTERDVQLLGIAYDYAVDYLNRAHNPFS